MSFSFTSSNQIDQTIMCSPTELPALYPSGNFQPWVSKKLNDQCFLNMLGVSQDRPPSVVRRQMQTEPANIPLSPLKGCTGRDARFIKSPASKLRASFIVRRGLWRFCTRAALRNARLSTAAFNLVGGPSSELISICCEICLFKSKSRSWLPGLRKTEKLKIFKLN